ncbi:MAG: hypothetical protein ACE5ER_04975 [Nitrospinaceae bacterium]
MNSRSRPERIYTLNNMSRYWAVNPGAVERLPIAECHASTSEIPPSLKYVVLPDWAAQWGVNGVLCIPVYAITEGGGAEWQRVDWLEAAFWYLQGCGERAFENAHGPIHSYSFRLTGWDSRVWERAWVNRIALFLRAWAARQAESSEDRLFGPLPEAEWIFTHDVDAVRKTWPIRFKQLAFQTYNAGRNCLQGKVGRALDRLTHAAQFLLGGDDYWRFEELVALEEAAGVRSHFNFYGGAGGWARTAMQIFLDPDYDVLEPQVRDLIKNLSQLGYRIGVHSSFYSWNAPEQLQSEKERVERALEGATTVCRNHWLRFSWKDAWETQQAVGFQMDTTLGFNDRSGFRVGAALPIHPWAPDKRQPMEILSLPMVIMDSHVYDYQDLDDPAREAQLSFWLEEVRQVKGVATLIWHPHALSADYGWSPGLRYILNQTPSLAVR